MRFFPLKTRLLAGAVYDHVYKDAYGIRFELLDFRQLLYAKSSPRRATGSAVLVWTARDAQPQLK